MLSAVEQLVDACLYESVVSTEFLCATGIVAIIAVDNLKSLFFDSVHVGLRH